MLLCVLKNQKPRNWREEICCKQNTIAKRRKKIEKRKRRSSEGVLHIVKMRVLPTMVLKKPPSNPKAFLFDIDGTLCDSDPVHFECFQELIKEVPSVKNPTGLNVEFVSSDINLLVTSKDSKFQHLEPVDLSLVKKIKIILPNPYNSRKISQNQ